ncbi:MAG: hypothetical protein ACFFFG_01500 [Candidatus Thorarchaeota archaeon]
MIFNLKMLAVHLQIMKSNNKTDMFRTIEKRVLDLSSKLVHVSEQVAASYKETAFLYSSGIKQALDTQEDPKSYLIGYKTVRRKSDRLQIKVDTQKDTITDLQRLISAEIASPDSLDQIVRGLQTIEEMAESLSEFISSEQEPAFHRYLKKLQRTREDLEALLDIIAQRPETQNPETARRFFKRAAQFIEIVILLLKILGILL